MPKKSVSLKIKSIVLVSVPILATGVCLYITVLNVVNKKMREVSIGRFESSAKSGAANLREFLLPEPDTFMLSSFTRAMMEDKEIVYAKILDAEGEVIRSSSKEGGDYTKEGLYEISVPIMFGNEKIGNACFGFSLKNIERTMQNLRNTIIGVTGGILVLWIIITTTSVSIMIIRPINKLIYQVRETNKRINNNDFEDLDVQIKSEKNDEIGILADNFNNMLKSLKEKGFIERMFGTFVAKQVVSKILSQRDKKLLTEEGEKREVTILFADIRGFTILAATIPPQKVVELLNKYFAIMVDVIFKYEGIIDKYVGDQIMAFWGAPVEQKNASLKAVSSGLEIQKRLKSFNLERKRNNEELINVGIGISTGEVIAGSIGTRRRMDYTVIGDSVNLAERIESISKQGQVYISEETYFQVKEHCIVRTLEPIKLKGREKAVPIYEVLAIK